MTLEQLKTRAKHHGLLIRRNGYGDSEPRNFSLVDISTNAIAAYPQVMTLEEVSDWLDDLDE